MDGPVAFPLPQRNSTSDEIPVGQMPDLTTDVHTKSLAVAVVCSCTSIAIVCLFFYCCCRARYADSYYDCSCTYERPVSQTSLQMTNVRGSKATVISGSISIKIPSSDSNRFQPFRPSTDTILEQSESEEGSSTYFNSNPTKTKNSFEV